MTKTLGYAITSRANTRSGGGEEDGQRRPLCGGFTETKRRADRKARSSRDETRERSHLPKHSAPFSLSVPPLPAHRIHSPVVENPLRRVQGCAVKPGPPCCSFPRMSLSVSGSVRILSFNARGLKRKLVPADRKSLIRLFFFFACCTVSEGR